MNASAPWYLANVDSGSPDLGLSLYCIDQTNAHEPARLIAATKVEIKRPADRHCPVCRAQFKPACRHGIESEVVMMLCDAAEKTLQAWGMKDGILPRVMIAEQPQSFGGPERGDRSVLLCHAVMACLLDRARAWTQHVYQYTAAVWKGPKRKDLHQREALARFSPTELAVLPLRPVARDFQSDPLDSAALGLWWLESVRIRPIRFYARAADFIGRVEPYKPRGRKRRS